MPKERQDIVKAAALLAARDPDPPIRAAAGSIISTVASQSPLAAWPELLPGLVEMLDSGEPVLVAGALDAVLKLCEESADELDSENLGRPLNALVPRLLVQFQSADTRAAAAAVAAVTALLPQAPAALILRTNELLHALASVSRSPDANLRAKVCTAFLTVLEVNGEALAPFMPQVCEVMLAALTDPDSAVALEAGEFFHATCAVGNESGNGLEACLEPLLPRLVPALLGRMAYDAEERAQFESEPQDNADVPDRPEDVRPMFHRSRGGHGCGGGGYSGGVGNDGGGGGEEEEDDDGRGGGDAEEVAVWSVRKSAAAALDAIAGTFGPNPLLPTLLGCLEQMFGSGDPWVNEAAVLALGAVSDGCSAGIEPHLPMLFPVLGANTRALLPQLRSISCWALSRYAWWTAARAEEDAEAEAASPADGSGGAGGSTSSGGGGERSVSITGAGHALYVAPTTHALLRCVGDRNKKVQEAACSALSTMLDACGTYLLPYLPEIAAALGHAATRYQTRSQIVLWDSIGTVADAIGTEMARLDIAGPLLPPLLERLHRLHDGDHMLFPLLECLASVAQALGQAFAEVAPPVYGRCLRLVGTGLAAERQRRAAEVARQAAEQQEAAARQAAGGNGSGGGGRGSGTGGRRSPTGAAGGNGHGHGSSGNAGAGTTNNGGADNGGSSASGGGGGGSGSGPRRATAAEEASLDPEFIVCALDLLSGMAEGLGPAMSALAERSLVEALLECTTFPVADVRQSAFALLGDLVRGGVAALVPALPHLLAAAVENVAVAEPRVCCNASWSLGELCVAAGGDAVAPFSAAATDRLVAMLTVGTELQQVRDNAAVALGRLAAVCPQPVAAALPHACRPWCRALVDIADRRDKAHAFRGLCRAATANPPAAAEALPELCFAAASWYDPQEPVPEELRGEIEALLQRLKRGVGARWDGCVRRFSPDVLDYLVVTYRL
ncbi:unnamed protein product [Phaeothamnion confervicola]